MVTITHSGLNIVCRFAHRRKFCFIFPMLYSPTFRISALFARIPSVVFLLPPRLLSSVFCHLSSFFWRRAFSFFFRKSSCFFLTTSGFSSGSSNLSEPICLFFAFRSVRFLLPTSHLSSAVSFLLTDGFCLISDFRLLLASSFRRPLSCSCFHCPSCRILLYSHPVACAPAVRISRPWARVWW